jgi:hypothetical protein
VSKHPLPSLTIVVPTIGRPTLATTLASIARQDLHPGDRVIVALDTFEQPERPDIVALVASYGFELLPVDGGVHFFGNPQLNAAIRTATTEYLCALGDDDIYVDGALARIRPQLVDGRAGLVQFLSPWREILWDAPVLRVSHISGCCLFAPVPSLVEVKTEQRIEVDFDWIVDVVARTGQPPIWIRDCAILARPEIVNGQPVQALAEYRPRARQTGRPLRVLLAHPGASWSTADVYEGLIYGLRAHGVTVIPYRLDTRIEASTKALHWLWRTKKKTDPTLEKPNTADVMYRLSPACMASAEALRRPAKHLGDLPSHDVVFVGSGFPERITWFNAIDWTGIDLGLYGTWDGLGLKKEVAACVRGPQITTKRRPRSTDAQGRPQPVSPAAVGREPALAAGLPIAESLEPARLRARGVRRVSFVGRPQGSAEVFGDLVPTFRTPSEAAALIRLWLRGCRGTRACRGTVTGLRGRGVVDRAR